MKTRGFTDTAPLLDDELGAELDRIMAGEAEAEPEEAPKAEVPEGLEDYAEEDMPPSRIEQDLWIDRRLRALAMIEAEIEHNNAVAKARVEEIEAWVAGENAPLERQKKFLEEQLMLAARTYPYAGKKSRRFPSGGELGSRHVPECIVITDEAEALAYAKAHPGLAVDVKVKESIGLKSLLDFYRSTDVIPPGCDLVPAEERYFVKAPKRDN